MPQETLYTQILDLDSLDVYLETPTNDESYFSVRGLPEQIGFGLLQVKNDDDTFVACFEDGLHFGNSETILMCNKEQPASKLAILILVSVLSGRPIHAPECPCCTEESQ